MANFKKEFDKYFNEINPKNMVKFIDAYRNQGLYAFDMRDGSDFLLDESHEDSMLHMINCGDFLFGTEKEEREIERKQ